MGQRSCEWRLGWVWNICRHRKLVVKTWMRVQNDINIPFKVIHVKYSFRFLKVWGYNLGNAGCAKAAGCCQFKFQTLHATSQDGSSLESVAARAGRECHIQDERGRGLYRPRGQSLWKLAGWQLGGVVRWWSYHRGGSVTYRATQSSFSRLVGLE